MSEWSRLCRKIALGGELSGSGLPSLAPYGWIPTAILHYLLHPASSQDKYPSARCMRHSTPYPAPTIEYRCHNHLPPQRLLRPRQHSPLLGRHIRFHRRTSLSDLSISSPLPQVTTDPAKSPVRQSTSTPPYPYALPARRPTSLFFANMVVNETRKRLLRQLNSRWIKGRIVSTPSTSRAQTPPRKLAYPTSAM